MVLPRDTMTVALMQPYFFPYVGDFRLIYAVDTFVFYDDVAFITQGWINRNRVLVGGVPRLFTVPVQKASSFVPINETRVDLERLPRWRRRFLLTLRESYASAPCRERVLDLVEAALQAATVSVAALARRSVEVCGEYLGVTTNLLVSSRACRQTRPGPDDAPAVSTLGSGAHPTRPTECAE